MNPGGVESGEGQGAVQEGGDMCVYLWLIHVDVWQKPTQYCKAIILQLKKKKATGKIKQRIKILAEDASRLKFPV